MTPELDDWMTRWFDEGMMRVGVRMLMNAGKDEDWKVVSHARALGARRISLSRKSISLNFFAKEIDFFIKEIDFFKFLCQGN